MSKEKALARNLIAAGVVLVLFVVVGLAFSFFLLPLLQGDLITSTSSQSQYDHDLTMRLDSFSGYAVLRSDAFREDLKRQGVRLELEDDQADYGARLKALKRGQAQMAVFTIDALIAAGADLGEHPASIVMVIDETAGADAILAYKSAVPTLGALDTKGAAVYLTPDSPSEFLMRVAIAEFGLTELSTRWKAEDGADAVHKAMKKAKRSEPAAFVVWEPVRSAAIQDDDVVVLFDSSRLSGYIVDVLVAERGFLRDHPDVVQGVVEAYQRSLYAQEQSGGLVDLVLKDAKLAGDKLSASASRSIVDGIHWRTTLENYAHFGLVPPEHRGGVHHLEDSIANISTVLVRTGKLSSAPLDGRENELFYSGALQRMRDADFHPSKGLGIAAGGLGTADLAPIRGGGELTELGEAEWSSLSEVGTLAVPPIAFARGTARLNVQSQRELTDLARRLQGLPNTYLSVVGHTRSEGDPEANRRLALERAEAAQAFLVSSGIPTQRLRAVAGEAAVGGRAQAVSFVLGQRPY